MATVMQKANSKATAAWLPGCKYNMSFKKGVAIIPDDNKAAIKEAKSLGYTVTGEATDANVRQVPNKMNATE